MSSAVKFDGVFLSLHEVAVILSISRTLMRNFTAVVPRSLIQNESVKYICISGTQADIGISRQKYFFFLFSF